MKRCIFIACVAGQMLLATIQACAAADADVLRRFGILGRQAVDCSAPPGQKNPHMIFAVGANGNATRTLKGRGDLDATLAIRNLRIVGPNVLEWDETGRASELTVSIIKQSDGKFRSWRSVRTSGPDKGQVLIADGKMSSSGSETTAFTFCGQ